MGGSHRRDWKEKSYGKIECNFCALLVNLGEETGLFIGRKLVGQGRGGGEGGKGREEKKSRWEQHSGVCVRRGGCRSGLGSSRELLMGALARTGVPKIVLALCDRKRFSLSGWSCLCQPQLAASPSTALKSCHNVTIF